MESQGLHASPAAGVTGGRFAGAVGRTAVGPPFRTHSDPPGYFTLMKLRFLLAALALSAATAAPAEAYQRGRGIDLGQTLSPNEARDAVQEGRHVPLRQIISQIEARYPGRMLGAELQRGNPSIYVIDWLTPDGRKLTIRANAQTGAIIGVSG